MSGDLVAFKPRLVVLEWEFADGSGGTREYDDHFTASCVAIGVMRAWPEARVWVGLEQLQQGFIASDERA